MAVVDIIRDGNLTSALSQAQRDVRLSPTEVNPRVLLFQLQALMGQWDSAIDELKELGKLNPGLMATVQSYFSALEAEKFREDVFSGKQTPVVLGEPAPWVAWLIEALRLFTKKRFDEAKALREQALEAAPAIAGTINGEPFAWIADADSRLGPVLEVILTKGYIWMPFAKLRKIEVEPPTDLRDLAWTPATLTFTNGGKTVAFLPVRYPGSEVSVNNKIRLARLTEWTERPGETFVGLGQRLLTTDKGEYPLLDVRQITLESPDEPVEAAPPAAGGEPNAEPSSTAGASGESSLP